MKRSHRKHKTQKSESEEYDSLGSDTESGSGDHIRNRTDQSIHLDDHDANSYISKYKMLSIPIYSKFEMCLYVCILSDKTPHKIMVNYRL